MVQECRKHMVIWPDVPHEPRTSNVAPWALDTDVGMAGHRSCLVEPRGGGKSLQQDGKIDGSNVFILYCLILLEQIFDGTQFLEPTLMP